MSPDTTYTRALKLAVEMAGSEARLAQALGTSAEMLHKWVSGELPPPPKIYLAALVFSMQAAKKTGRDAQ